MIIYLDQNIWIDLAKIYHKKDQALESQKLLSLINNKLVDNKVIFPLSAIHYLETSTISNQGRRKRLGEAMYEISKCQTLASYSLIVQHELEAALSEVYDDITPTPFSLLGNGVSHAFNENIPIIPDSLQQAFEKSCLTGEQLLGEYMGGFPKTPHNERFNKHLEELRHIKESLPKSKWEDALNAISFIDIRKPLFKVLHNYGIPPEEFIKTISKETLRLMLSKMPSRKLDTHLHFQVLRNSEYKPKPTDLEDWAGAALASQYCDYIITEKHMADMLLRDNFCPKEKVLTKLHDLKPLLEKI